MAARSPELVDPDPPGAAQACVDLARLDESLKTLLDSVQDLVRAAPPSLGLEISGRHGPELEMLRAMLEQAPPWSAEGLEARRRLAGLMAELKETASRAAARQSADQASTEPPRTA